jgi:hypothetical protein
MCVEIYTSICISQGQSSWPFLLADVNYTTSANQITVVFLYIHITYLDQNHPLNYSFLVPLFTTICNGFCYSVFIHVYRKFYFSEASGVIIIGILTS